MIQNSPVDNDIVLQSRSHIEDLLQCEKKFWFAIHNTSIEGSQSAGKGAAGIPAVSSLEIFQKRRVLRHIRKQMETTGRYVQPATGRWLWGISLSDKKTAEIIRGLAYLRWASEKSGSPVEKCLIAGIDRSRRFPDLDDIIPIRDVTSETDTYMSLISGWMEKTGEIISRVRPPDIPVGPQCFAPTACSCLCLCGGFSGTYSVCSIPNLSWEKRLELMNQGVVELSDIPADYPLNRRQRTFIRLHGKAGKTINKEEIAREFSALTFPLCFLDFETDAPPVPLHPGMAAFEKFPFQFSCHNLHADGRLEHFHYLHPDGSDPRPLVAEKLLASVPPSGSILAYNAGFEKSVILDLSRAVPTSGEELQGIAFRLFDLYQLIRRTIRHPGFNNSYSLKSILPVLVPSLSHTDLEGVKEGTAALAAFDRFIRETVPEEREKLRKSLLDYCRLDTLALVEIYRVLADAIAETPSGYLYQKP